MVAIAPFAALRYDLARVSSLSDVLSPPYDVLTPDDQERLYQASPHNIVRLILGKRAAGDTPQDNWYARAQQTFAAWRRDGVLAVDPAPALYLVDHAFDDQGRAMSRLGFIATLRLADATARSVLRHEATLAAPKEDRTRLLEAIPANLEPIFCVYPDEGRRLQTLLERRRAQAMPDAHAEFQGGQVRLWRLTEPRVIDEITQRLEPKAVLIADGHHRFEVGVAHRRRYGSLMSYFVSMADPGLVMRPIHRLIEGTGAPAPERLDPIGRLEPAASLSELLAWLESDEAQGCYGYADGARLYRVTVHPARIAQWLEAPSVPQPLAALDVSILHGLVLPHLGAADASLRYTADPHRAWQEVSAQSGRCAWLLRGIPLQQVYALALHGLTLPPKSTYFYPKVPSGLAINLLTSQKSPC